MSHANDPVTRISRFCGYALSRDPMTRPIPAFPRPPRAGRRRLRRRMDRDVDRVDRRGWSLPEMLVVAGIIGVLLAVLIPMLSKVREAQKEVTCLSNLRNLGYGFKSYAAAEGGSLPNPSVTQVPWETAIRPYMSQSVAVFACPSDGELAPVTKSSYDWRDTGEPLTTLAGKRLADARPDAVLALEGLPGWHSRGIINAVQVDGSASRMAQQDCVSDMDKPVSPYAGK